MNIEALAARVAALAGDRRLRIAVALLGFAAITLVGALIAHPKTLAIFHEYDDEGYMLTALKSFVKHGHLYDQVFTQYGPFYYEFWGGIFGLFGIPVTHDAGRTAVMIAWVVSSLGFGLATLRITRSIVLGLATQILTFSALEVLTYEPMHPVGLVAVLLAAIVIISTFVAERDSTWGLAVLGGVVAALVLTKVNVGAFAVVSVALACMVSYRELWGRRWPRLVVEVLFVAVPILLTLGKFGEGWARHYGIHVAAAALAVVIALRANRPARRAFGEMRWLLGGFVVVVLVCCLTIIASGTSLHGLIDGVIRQPLRQADAFSLPFQLSRRFYAFDLIAIGGACAYWVGSRRRGAPSPGWLGAWSVFSIVVGITLAFSIVGQLLPFNDRSLSGYQLGMLPFAWVGLLVTVPDEAARPSFARLLLPLLAVLQALHGYPVAGSQTLLSAVLLVPVGALCVANGVRGLSHLLDIGPERLALAGFAAVLVVCLGWFTVRTYLKEPLDVARAEYHNNVELHLPGSHDIHLPSEQAALYEAVVAGMRKNCTTTVMEPGMDSFYLWTGEEPPSYTATGWETLFDEAHQEKVIEDTAQIRHLCLLRNEGMAAGWGLRPGPLVTYLEEGFRPVAKWGAYELLRREGPAPSS